MKKILLAYDGGEPARRALQMAGEFARAFHAPLSVVSVVPAGAARPGGDPREITSARERELEEAKRLLEEMGLAVELLEPSGDPAGRIEQIAEEGGFDTIILGSGRGDAIDPVLGDGGSRRVAEDAAAMVVVVH
jgi:nucleotide-binding universal stress UspA family protein